MNPQTRTVVFAMLLIGISSAVLVQSAQASMGQGAVAKVLESFGPLQVSNSTTSANESVSTMSSSANSTTMMNLSPSANTTALATLSPVAVSSGYNDSTAVSYLQFQLTSMSMQLSAMSSSIDSLGQQGNNNTVLGEAGLIVGIIAFVVAIAVAKRADALNRGAPQGQAATPTGPKP